MRRIMRNGRLRMVRTFSLKSNGKRSGMRGRKKEIKLRNTKLRSGARMTTRSGMKTGERYSMKRRRRSGQTNGQ